jgi:hypothetical protein
MKFFFPDSQDLVDPGFDFEKEQYAEFRVRQRDDCYAHEVLSPPPFDGILVSKAIVDGVGPEKTGKYSLAQRHRIRRVGVRKFFRAGPDILFMGDCGAFSYKERDVPPYTAQEVVEFYSECRFDYGISVDHLVLEYHNPCSEYLPDLAPDITRARERQELTIVLAEEFLALARLEGGFEPIGVAQGWSPKSYAEAVSQLQALGYRYIALGSMVPLKTNDIIACLERVSVVRSLQTKLHLLGVTRLDHIVDFAGYGVASFDSTSPLLQAFKDNKDNYYVADSAFTAIRVPQVEGNPKLAAAIRAGRVDGRIARQLEQRALRTLRAYDSGSANISTALQALSEYSAFVGITPDRSADYARLLEARPWQSCPCNVCRRIGIEVVVFRGSERNKRRGFHNLHVFRERLRRSLGSARQAETLTG